jgi:hypothetical protein
LIPNCCPNYFECRFNQSKPLCRGTSAIQADLGYDTTAAEDELIRNAAIAGAMIKSLAAQWLAGQEIEPGSLTALMNVQQRFAELCGTCAEAAERDRAAVA